VCRRSFDEGFPGVTDRFEWFAIDYTARFWVSEPGKYRFALASDDGSVNLKMGEHAIRVSYFQGPRYQVALVLRVARPGEQELRVFHTDDFKPPSDSQ
jgi:hypothetical protein